ncbi:unnamed protein product, partial [Didymodactylos carnosus]
MATHPHSSLTTTELSETIDPFKIQKLNINENIFVSLDPYRYHYALVESQLKSAHNRLKSYDNPSECKRFIQEHPNEKIILSVVLCTVEPDELLTNEIDKHTELENDKRAFIIHFYKTLLRMETTDEDHHELINMCRKMYADDKFELQNIEKFEREYKRESAITWYTRETFVYRQLNKALRSGKFEMLFAFRFLIKDIYEQLKMEYEQQQEWLDSIRLYHGQSVSAGELTQLQNTIGHYISFDSFLSATKSEQLALIYSDENNITNTTQSVVFNILVEPSRLQSSKPFASISHLSHFGSAEEEYLIMLGAIFYIVDVSRDNDDKRWIVYLRLCNENEHELHELYQHLSADLPKETNLADLGDLCQKMGQDDTAEIFYGRCITGKFMSATALSRCFVGLGNIAREKGDYNLAINYHQRTLDLLSTTHGSDDRLFLINSNLALVYCDKGNYDLAIECLEKAVSVAVQIYGENSQQLDGLYTNLGIAHSKKMNYEKAFEYFRKSLELKRNRLPENHPERAALDVNVANVHNTLHEYDVGLIYYEKALNNWSKTLPKNHPDLATLYFNIGTLYESMEKFEIALKNYRKAAEVYENLNSANPKHIGQSAAKEKIKDVTVL